MSVVLWGAAQTAEDSVGQGPGRRAHSWHPRFRVSRTPRPAIFVSDPRAPSSPWAELLPRCAIWPAIDKGLSGSFSDGGCFYL